MNPHLQCWVDTVCCGCGCHFPKRLCEYTARLRLEKQPKFWCDLKCRGLHARDSDTGFRILMQQVKHSAKDRNKILELDADFLRELWKRQDGKCAYTKIPMELPEHWKPRQPYTVSIDRIDSGKDYLRDNVELVCMFVNLGKNGFTKECIQHFISMVQKPSTAKRAFKGVTWHTHRRLSPRKR